MGGPGVAALTCVQHISEAAEMVRALKDAHGEQIPVELKLHIVNVLEQLAEAKLAGVEAQEEVHSISAYAEMRDAELQGIFQAHAEGRLVTPALPKPKPKPKPELALPPNEDADRAANLVRLVSFAAADQGFRSLDTFATWFVGGTAAAVGLMIANFDKIEPIVSGLDLQWTLVKVVIALGLIGVAKFCGSLVCTMARGSERALEVFDAWQKRGIPTPSFEAFEAARDAAVPAPFRWLPKSFRHKSYSATLQARQVMVFLMIAGMSTLTAVGLVIVVLVDIAMAL